jgi:beta-lactamase regulating signal transducer with metallopeptidase domain/photosystem II stability/assembly factor-like uncharacterized protein
MSYILNFYPGDKFVLLAANVLLQVAVVVIAAWFLGRIVFPRNAAVRHNIWLSALILVLFSPLTALIADAAGLWLFTISAPRDSWPERSTASVESNSNAQNEIAELQPPYFQQQTSATIAENQPDAANAMSDKAPLFDPKSRPLTAVDRLRAIAVPVIAFWGLGMSYFLIRLCMRGRALRRLFETARPVDESGNLRPVFAEIRRLMGIENLPCIMLWRDEKISITPLSVGIFRPAIILSKNLLKNLDHEELCDVLVHECAHVLRRDPFIGLLQRIAQVMFWPYPLVWLMNRNLARAREEVCDNYVLLRTNGPRYAQMLFDLSRQIHSISPSLAQVGLFQCLWPLEQRVAGLLDTRRTVMTKIRPLTMSVLAVLFVSLAVLAAGTKAQSPASKDKSKDTTSSDSGSDVSQSSASTKDIVTGKTRPSKGEKISPENYEKAKAETPDAEKLLLMGLVENYFLHNARDVGARESLEWGDVEKNPDGTRSIRYKFKAKFGDRDTKFIALKFTFDKDNVMVSFEVLTPSHKKEPGNWTNWNNGQSLGSFFAVAGTAKETVAVGIDGLIATRDNTTGIWTIQTFTGDPDFRAIVYAHNQYVVVREAGFIMTSPDGLKWTSRTSPTKENLMGLFWDGHQYIAGGDKGTILSSPDGIKWTSRNSGSQIRDLSGLSYSGTRYVAVGNAGILISSDSITWTTPKTAPTSVWFTSCTWTGDEFLACGLGFDENPTIYTSPDGDVWTLRDTTIRASLRAATTINGTIYVAGDSLIAKSTDGGTTWTDTYNNSGMNKLFMGLAGNGEYLIAVGFNHNVWAMPVPAAP